MADLQAILNKVGEGLLAASVVVGAGTAKAGKFLGQKVMEGYRAVDPDAVRQIVQTPLLAYSLFVSRHEKIEPGVPDGYPPLVMVHGLGGNRGTFLFMAAYLKLFGRKRAYKIQFDNSQSPEEMADALANFIEDVKTATGENRVDMVAHSLGGLIARMAMSRHNLADSVNTLVMLGTPHKGTYSARFAHTKILRRIRPDSDLIVNLNKIPWPASVRGVNFWSRNDMMILPHESAIIEGLEQIDVSPFTHYSYLISPRCWANVARILTRDMIECRAA